MREPMKLPADAAVPAARSEGLVVEQLPGETLVYDLERDEAHLLGPTASAVFALCDGQRTVAAIAAEVADRLEDAVTPETVHEALNQLTACDLLVAEPTPAAGVSRRELVRKVAHVGAGAAAAPLIYSIVAPVPAAAQSPGCTPNGAMCADTSGSVRRPAPDCCSGECNQVDRCCLPVGSPCSLADPGACCSLACNGATGCL